MSLPFASSTQILEPQKRHIGGLHFFPRSLREHRRSASNSKLYSTTSSESTAIIIVDHGSRRRESNEQLEKFTEMYRQASGGQTVVAAHMEIASPSIEEAMQQCISKGCRSFIIAPYFLSNGRHIQQDIPALVAEAKEKLGGVDCVIADPIGLDLGMVDIIKQRVQSATQAALPTQ